MRAHSGSSALILAATFLVPVPSAGQAPAALRPDSRMDVPRTPDGRPDLQGMWTNATLTPLERARTMGDRKFYTEQEVRDLETRTATQRADANERAPTPSVAGSSVGNYNNFWLDSGDRVLSTRQTSLVVDPPDGRVPVKPEAEAQRDENLRRSGESPEFMSVWDRCISRGAPGWVIPAGYNNAYQIIQTRDYIVIHSEMIHDARIIPLTPRDPLPAAVKQWEGDSRGRWEGDTLVVETTNFTNKNWIATSAASGRIKGIPQSEALRIVERFTRISRDEIAYEARIEDPAVFTQPWTLAFPMTRDEGYRIYEYACHEGNHAVENILRGARYADRAGSSSR
jgi:hypothetical protein